MRFGGGTRRRETIDAQYTYSPYLSKELPKRATLFPMTEIAQIDGLETSHGQGTLNIITGKYGKYEDVSDGFLRERFEPEAPTVFEYLRKTYNVPSHQTLIVNGEDRIDEEFYTFSNHHLFGLNYRSNVLSLYRFKTYLLRHKVDEWDGSEKELKKMREELHKMESLDDRNEGAISTAEIDGFWERWRQYYGDTGFVNPRGDRLLTELAIRAIRELRPRLLMVNYNDCDYVHWGYLSHYTRAISIMDEGLKQLVETVERDEEYRDNTIFVVVPDCGRDSNPMSAVPCQHHFGSRSAHEIFAMMWGPGIPQNTVVDRVVQQADVAPTIAQYMGFKGEFMEGAALAEAIA